MNAQPLRVCYFGTYRANYSRNQIMIEGLRRNGVEVIECHETLWHGIEDRVQTASGGWLRPSFVCRVARVYWRLLRRYREVGGYDVMVLGYPGQMDVCLGRVLTWLRRRPLVLDVFMSIYLIAEERGLTERHPLTGRLIWRLEKLALRLPDLRIQDTGEYVAWFGETYGLSPGSFRLVPTGADDRVFRPAESGGDDDGILRVLYYGTFIPNHGVKHIVEAARILREETDIYFELAGDGPTRNRAEAMVQEHRLTNVAFLGWVDKRSLPARVAKTDLFLGAFGTTPQSMMTVQNKIYEGLAMAQPVITGDSPTVRSQLEHGKEVFLVDREDPHALAQAILTLRDDSDLRQRLAEYGYQRFSESFTAACVGRQTRRHLQALVSTRSGSEG
jgi:glycosyltransferase involved in cell wall biosynthesis